MRILWKEFLQHFFDAFVCKNKMKAPYTDSISIAAGEGEMTLFAREIEVQTDAQKVQKTVYSIQSRLGYPVYDTLLHALCHFEGDKSGTAVLGYLVRAFAQGRGISDQLADPFAFRVMELSRKVDNELDKLLGFCEISGSGKYSCGAACTKMQYSSIDDGSFFGSFSG